MNEDTTGNILSLGLALIEANSYAETGTSRLAGKTKAPLIDMINPQPKTTHLFYAHAQPTKQKTTAPTTKRIKRRKNVKAKV